jgi:hypothetical protein
VSCTCRVWLCIWICLPCVVQQDGHIMFLAAGPGQQLLHLQQHAANIAAQLWSSLLQPPAWLLRVTLSTCTTYA